MGSDLLHMEEDIVNSAPQEIGVNWFGKGLPYESFSATGPMPQIQHEEQIWIC